MINPFKTHLTILQQEGYQPGRFMKWWNGHPFTFAISHKKRLINTSKAQVLTKISVFFLSVFLSLTIVNENYTLTLLVILLFFLAPFTYLFLALLVLTPYEQINRRQTILRIRKIVLGNKDLTNIGITGSYGKTSVKDFLFIILSSWKNTIKTPESYNTIFGIAKVADFELLSKTEYFICEMGAYVRGEITELCEMVPPQYAILTAIGSQHLERFKNISNTTLAKFELIDSVENGHALVNLDNQLIANHLKNPKYKNVLTYSLIDSRADFYVTKYNLSPTGIDFSIKYRGITTDFKSSLFGTSNLYNLTAAISMSLLLEVPKEIVKKQVSQIQSTPHRLELKKINKAILIDNAYSSNEDGFTSIVNDLKKIKGKKVIITPGIIELGKSSGDIHQRLGKNASDVFNKFILVGISDRTKALTMGIGTNRKADISYIENSTNLWPLIEKLSHEYDWILVENDLPDIF